jgi:protocatechuate 4,5-dioxygenase beta chain
VAELVAVIASTHHPFYYRASTSTGEDRPPFADEWVRKVEAFRETLTRARPDVLVMVGSDHFHQLWLDNMPQFLVGKAPVYDANWYNEEREFGLPRMVLKGQEDLSAYILREGLDAGFDLAFSNELRIDHSITCPIITLRPEADLPIVPVYTNIFAPPLPQPKRFVQLGRTIRELVESWPSSWAGRASSARTGPTRSSTRRPWSGSRRATSRAASPRSASTACTPPATPPTGSWTSC